MPFREAIDADLPALAALYAEAVRAAGPAYYTPEQVETWATAAGLPTFRRLVPRPLTLVAEDEFGPAGFAGLAPDGHVASLYVRPDRMRQGIASALLRALLDHAADQGIERLYTEASALSRPVFERFGFALDEVERVELRGVAFERYRMVRRNGTDRQA
ncbi:MAG: GNAT family N-acetyltransferase [Bacteroidota bacterium]